MHDSSCCDGGGGMVTRWWLLALPCSAWPELFGGLVDMLGSGQDEVRQAGRQQQQGSGGRGAVTTIIIIHTIDCFRKKLSLLHLRQCGDGCVPVDLTR